MGADLPTDSERISGFSSLKQRKEAIRAVAYDPSWPEIYAAERAKIPAMAALGYQLVETGMPKRLFLRKHARGYTFHLHIVEYVTWDERNECILRDYLLAHPEAAQASGDLKRRLADEHAHDGLAYAKAKTAFIQLIVDQARDLRGLPRVDVWEE